MTVQVCQLPKKIDQAKQFATDVLKTASKRAIRKIAEVAGNLSSDIK